ncbi:MAG TPA: hypothetical protein VG826_10975 [Pirellulales bacterium]|nr:hypothetical protein [Pirellulales bacterium]
MWHSLAQSVRLRAVMLFGTLAVTLAAAEGFLRECRADVQRLSKSAREAAIAAALDQPTELDFADQPLADVIDYLQQHHGIQIEVDRKAFADGGLGVDTPITRSIKGISLESALDLILTDLDLTWMIHDEVLFITSKLQAETIIETRVYPVRDLVTSTAGESPAGGSDYESLVDVLSQAAGNDGGAARSIRIYRPASALVITRPIVVHRRIEKLLKELRQAKGE